MKEFTLRTLGFSLLTFSILLLSGAPAFSHAPVDTLQFKLTIEEGNNPTAGSFKLNIEKRTLFIDVDLSSISNEIGEVQLRRTDQSPKGEFVSVLTPFVNNKQLKTQWRGLSDVDMKSLKSGNFYILVNTNNKTHHISINM